MSLSPALAALLDRAADPVPRLLAAADELINELVLAIPGERRDPFADAEDEDPDPFEDLWFIADELADVITGLRRHLDTGTLRQRNGAPLD